MDIDLIITRAGLISCSYKDKSQDENPMEKIAHIHSEVSEIHRVLRNKKNEYDATFSPRWKRALANEMADVIILTLDIASLDFCLTADQISEAIERKLKVKENELEGVE